MYCIDNGTFHPVDDSDPFARPAFQMDPKAVLFTSAARDGKSSAAAGSGAFGTFNNGIVVRWHYLGY